MKPVLGNVEACGVGAVIRLCGYWYDMKDDVGGNWAAVFSSQVNWLSGAVLGLVSSPLPSKDVAVDVRRRLLSSESDM